MDAEKSVPLRLRFYREANKPIDEILHKVKTVAPTLKPDYYIKQSDNHLFLFIGESKRQFYSPHLHLEFESLENGNTNIRGLYGPNPMLWTMFMFLHFVVAGIFILFVMIAYSNWSLGKPFYSNLIVMFFMVVIWFVLYGIARYNRTKGIPQMKELEQIFNKLIS